VIGVFPQLTTAVHPLVEQETRREEKHQGEEAKEEVVENIFLS
jgi:hypothetical protein